jgi:hypothetical protein
MCWDWYYTVKITFLAWFSFALPCESEKGEEPGVAVREEVTRATPVAPFLPLSACPWFCLVKTLAPILVLCMLMRVGCLWWFWFFFLWGTLYPWDPPILWRGLGMSSYLSGLLWLCGLFWVQISGTSPPLLTLLFRRFLGWSDRNWYWTNRVLWSGSLLSFLFAVCWYYRLCVTCVICFGYWYHPYYWYLSDADIMLIWVIWFEMLLLCQILPGLTCYAWSILIFSVKMVRCYLVHLYLLWISCTVMDLCGCTGYWYSPGPVLFPLPTWCVACCCLC